MQPLVTIAKEAAERIKSESGLVHVVGHHDADGICAASILAIALEKLGKPFQITITKDIKPELIKQIADSKPSLVVFVDIGSGWLKDIAELPCDVIVADHHDLTSVWVSTTHKLIHVNPMLFGNIELAGAGVAYLIGREMVDDARLAQLALVGSVGDCGDYSLELFVGPSVSRERGLNLFGRFSRPLYTALESAGFKNSIQILTEIKISPRKTLAELDDSERQRLGDALVKERLAADKNVADLFTDVWTLANRPKELTDAKEFATLLNAVGRMGSPTIGIALCLGSPKALEDARAVSREYKRKLASALNWVESNPAAIRRTEHAAYITAGSAINSTIIGTVVSILARSGDGRPLIGLADSDDGVKVSGRSASKNMSKIIGRAAASVGGVSGGHEQAAGATIPAGSEKSFIEECENSLSFQDLQ